MSVFISLLMTLRDCARSRAGLQLEILALRHQLHVLERSHARRLRLNRFDRLLCLVSWQNAYVERFIGSVRRECLDHVIVLTAVGLRRVLNEYVAYYNDVSY